MQGSSCKEDTLNLQEYIIDSLVRVRAGTLDMVKGLTPPQLTWQPRPEANSVAFLLFHTFRVQDRYFHTGISPVGELWEREGWSARWQLPHRPPDAPAIWSTGNGWSPEAVASFQPPPLEEFLAYGDAVQENSLRIVRDLDPTRLDEAPQPDRREVTIARRLQQAVAHEAQHQGQIDFILGLLRAEGLS